MGFQQVFSASETTALYATASYKRIGALWLSRDLPERVDEPILNVVGYTDTGGSFSYWGLDALEGSLVSGPVESDIVGIHISQDTLYHADPDGRLWMFGLWVQTAMAGAHTVVLGNIRLGFGNFANALDTTTETYILYATYGIAGTVEDFAIDIGNNRCWIRSASENAGQVKMFNYATGALIASLYSPHKSKGIFPTGDGYVYIVDAFQWVHLYDYDGGYWGSARNPFTEGTGGSVYGWDSVYKRLLCMKSAAIGNAIAFRYAPNAVTLTVPIPRSVPRKNRITYFFSNLCGDGGEGVSARFAALTNEGVSIGSKLSDKDGDIIERIVPADTANQDVTVSVSGRTYIISPSDGAVLPQATIYVGSTDGFATASVIVITINGLPVTVSYTGKTTNSFTGCTGGTETLVTGAMVVG